MQVDGRSFGDDSSESILSATILSFPRPSRPNRFMHIERLAIAAAAVALSERWGVAFYKNDEDSEVASIGRQAGGDDAAFDTFGLALVMDGVELVALNIPEDYRVYPTIKDALTAMSHLAVV